MGEQIELKIEELAGLGDGVGMHLGSKVFVPCTMAGDVAEVEITRTTKDATYARLLSLVTPSPDRAVPVCVHFGECGGCQLQHLQQAYYHEFKMGVARAALRKAGYDPDILAPLLSFPAACRRRVVLKQQEDALGYYAQRSHQLVAIEECKVLEPALEALVLRLQHERLALPGVSELHINGCDEGYDVLLMGDRPITWHMQEPAILRVSLQGKGTLTTLFQSAPVTVTFGSVAVEPPPGAFLQAVRAAQEAITQRVVAACADAKHIADLFCGIGTYSFPLAAGAQVCAFEGEDAMVGAINVAVSRSGIGKKLLATRRDLFHSPLSAAELKRFDAVVINPPRAGAMAQTAALAEARVPRIAMVSCNPATFARDARMLKDAGYRLQHITPLDQFTYTPHLELVAEFHL